MMLAPVVLFVYNRVDHVKKTLTALAENDLARETEIYIFSDGPKSEGGKTAIEEVRAFIDDEHWSELFKKVHIIKSEKNNGLANSIISGVSKVIAKHDKVIVIEDDCVSRKDFLSYMNACLEFYRDDPLVWSIGGYTANLNYPDDYNHDVYLMGRTCSYAWATWRENWEKVDWNVSSYNQFKWNFFKRKAFNRYGDDRSKMLDLQQLGTKNSWAIRFCYAMFENRQYTIYPRETRIQNIGYDVGTHVSKNGGDAFKVTLKTDYQEAKLEHVQEDPRLVKLFAAKFHRPFYRLVAAFIKNVVLKKK